MKKPADFATYKRVRNLSFNDFNRWVTSVYGSGYVDGQDAINQGCITALSEDRLLEIILSVKGIGKNRAKELMQKILAEGVDDSLWG